LEESLWASYPGPNCSTFSKENIDFETGDNLLYRQEDDDRSSDEEDQDIIKEEKIDPEVLAHLSTKPIRLFQLGEYHP
jgi:hypothetical protein